MPYTQEQIEQAKKCAKFFDSYSAFEWRENMAILLAALESTEKKAEKAIRSENLRIVEVQEARTFAVKLGEQLTKSEAYISKLEKAGEEMWWSRSRDDWDAARKAKPRS